MPKTLLLADDSVTIQKVVGISFANEDVKLVTVDNGDDALARARELRPDIVLADVVMPGMNGYEVCEAIKSDEALRHVPVLLLTGTFEAYDEERARRAGADGHVTKPFEAQALVDLVNARLAEAATAAPSPAAPADAADPFEATAGAGGGGLDLFDEVTAPSGTAPGESSEAAPSAAEAEAPAAGGFAEAAGGFAEAAGGGFDVDERAADAFAFEAPDEVHDELSLSQRGPAAAPASPSEASRSDATVSLFEGEDDDAFANAETLPPVDSDVADEEAADPFAATRLMAPAEQTAAAAPEPAEAFGADAPFAPAGPSAEEELVGSPAPGAPAAAVDLDAGEAEPDAPQTARDYDVSSSDLGDPFAEEPAAPAAPLATREPPTTTPVVEPREEPTAAPVFEAREERPAAPEADRAPAEIPPVFRQQIQDALEKVAWEAFGDLAEKLVKDALDRVERVAWEVVPQMAETLLQEEIRRLRAEEEDGGDA